MMADTLQNNIIFILKLNGIKVRKGGQLSYMLQWPIVERQACNRYCHIKGNAANHKINSIANEHNKYYTFIS